MLKNLRDFMQAQPRTYLGLPRWAWSLVASVAWLAIGVGYFWAGKSGYWGGVILIAVFSSAVAVCPWTPTKRDDVAALRDHIENRRTLEGEQP